jgi:hypothetical protein
MKKQIARRICSSLLIISLFLVSTPTANVLAESHPHPVRISKMDLLVMSGEGSLNVIQTMHYQNAGEKGAPFFIGLPEKYENPYIIKGMPDDVEIEYQDTGILVNQDVPFGETTVVVGYTLPMQQRSIMPVITQPYLVEQVDVIIEVKSLIVSASNFLPQSNREKYGGNDFRRFTRLNLQPKEPWPILFRMYRGLETGKEPFQIAGEATDPSLPVVDHVHKKNIPKSVLNIFIIFFILTVGMISIRRSDKGMQR